MLLLLLLLWQHRLLLLLLLVCCRSSHISQSHQQLWSPHGQHSGFNPGAVFTGGPGFETPATHFFGPPVQCAGELQDMSAAGLMCCCEQQLTAIAAGGSEKASLSEQSSEQMQQPVTGPPKLKTEACPVQQRLVLVHGA